ncbi:MAG: bifunctional phosphopantothenoylcysteine decarboxylase/phosphopantothenate--cysteine ligase CoaBC [Bacteroidota bacterium]
MLAGKKILLGITGGIASYKMPWLVRDLKKAGAEVHIVMTSSATKFVTPIVLSALSQHDVLTTLWPPEKAGNVKVTTEHIETALWADLMLIAPASANTIAKIAYGVADNALTTLVLALRCPLAIAPSMDVDMYRHEATQHNIALLRERGIHILNPESGALASGLEGPGRLPELDIIVGFIDNILEKTHQNLRGKKILVTAGPTYEPIDPVRFIGNLSSGKMGYAIANAAAQRGADVTLVSGPVVLETPRHVRRINVRTAHEMSTTILPLANEYDAVIMAAAVADYTPTTVADHKLKKQEIGSNELSLHLKKTEDILTALGKKKNKTVLVGFALETHNEVAEAQSKLQNKNLDLIVVNNPLVEGAAFGSETNVVTIIDRKGTVEKFEKMSKFDVATIILDKVSSLFSQSR